MTDEKVIAILRSMGGKVDLLAANRIETLREWIKQQSEITDTCTYNVLGEVCEFCECNRKLLNTT